eukprot:6204981-Pleurochrysis_carterae.AAC.2
MRASGRRAARASHLAAADRLNGLLSAKSAAVRSASWSCVDGDVGASCSLHACMQRVPAAHDPRDAARRVR